MSRLYESLGKIEGASFQSEGNVLIGVIYIGLGEGKKPTVILLHGHPGLEKNTDIAYKLREMGWNVLMPHYRGCWGSEGKYSFTGIPADVKNAITYMEQKDFVDNEKIFLVGHSLGAWATVITAAQDIRIKGAVAIAGGASSTDVPPTKISEQQKERFGTLIKQGFLKGITPQEAIEDSARRTKELAPQDWIAKISPRPLLLIGGEQDATVNPERVKALFEKAKQPKKLVLIKDADHVFTNKRRELVRTVTNWLKAQT